MGDAGFMNWCLNSGISDQTRFQLADEGFTSFETVRLLTDADCDLLDLTQQQRVILKNAVAALNEIDPESGDNFYPTLSRYENEFGVGDDASRCSTRENVHVMERSRPAGQPEPEDAIDQSDKDQTEIAASSLDAQCEQDQGQVDRVRAETSTSLEATFQDEGTSGPVFTNRRSEAEDPKVSTEIAVHSDVDAAVQRISELHERAPVQMRPKRPTAVHGRETSDEKSAAMSIPQSKSFQVPGSRLSDSEHNTFSPTSPMSPTSRGFLNKIKSPKLISSSKEKDKKQSSFEKDDMSSSLKKKSKFPKILTRGRKKSGGSKETPSSPLRPASAERTDEEHFGMESGMSTAHERRSAEETQLASDPDLHQARSESPSSDDNYRDSFELQAGDFPLSEITELEEPIPKSLKQKYLENCTLYKDGTPARYRLPQVVTHQDDHKFLRKCEILLPELSGDLVAEEKVILCVGGTGAGKTTLVNGIVNFVLGVDWEDDFRFMIIPDKADENEVVCHSQTKYITSYTLHAEQDHKVPYKLTIIDTPGFGDTQGIEQDEQLDEKIRNLFSDPEHGIDQLDAVCFASKSSDNKLNAYQRYVYHRIMSIFGKDVEQNIFMMVTFADASYPAVIRTLEEGNIPFRAFFKFNNSALFADNQGSVSKSANGEALFNQMFWQMGLSSFDSFFNFLQNAVQPVSLLLTKDVLAKREALQVYIAGMQENVKAGLATLDELRQEMAVVRQHETEIALNRDFTYKVKEIYTEKVEKPAGQHVTNCQVCSRTCHFNCKFPNDGDKRRCSAMDANGHCKVCAPSHGGKCSWEVHFNMGYYFTFKEREVEKRAEDLFEKYQQATDMKLTAETLLAGIADKFKSIQGEVLWQTNEIRKCLRALSEIALKPNPLTTLDYIDQMIVSEKNDCSPGWRERVYQLEMARQKAEYLQNLADDGYDPWEEHTVSDLTDTTKESRNVSVTEFIHKLKSGIWSKLPYSSTSSLNE